MCERPFLSHRSDAKSGARDGQSPAHHAAEIQSRRRATKESHLNQTSVDGETFNVAVEVVASDDVENHVNARTIGLAPDRVHEVTVVIVDRDRRAETPACRAFVVRSGRCIHDRAEHMRELNRGCPDSAFAAVNETPFPGANAPRWDT